MAGNKKFGENLKRLREAKGLKQEELAELVGLEYQTISRIETGYYFTSFSNLSKISEALGVTLKDLFDFSEVELTQKDLLKMIISDVEDFEIDDLQIIRKMINLYKKSKQY